MSIPNDDHDYHDYQISNAIPLVLNKKTIFLLSAGCVSLICPSYRLGSFVTHGLFLP